MDLDVYQFINNSEGFCIYTCGTLAITFENKINVHCIGLEF